MTTMTGIDGLTVRGQINKLIGHGEALLSKALFKAEEDAELGQADDDSDMLQLPSVPAQDPPEPKSRGRSLDMLGQVAGMLNQILADESLAGQLDPATRDRARLVAQWIEGGLGPLTRDEEVSDLGYDTVGDEQEPGRVGRVENMLLRMAEGMDVKLSVKAIINKKFAAEAPGYTLVLRDAGSDWWDLPGGHVQDGETLRKALAREVFEETGLHLERAREHMCKVLTLGGETKPVVFYKAGVKEGEVKLSDEHTGHVWASGEDLKTLNLGVFKSVLIPGGEDQSVMRPSHEIYGERGAGTAGGQLDEPSLVADRKAIPPAHGADIGLITGDNPLLGDNPSHGGLYNKEGESAQHILGCPDTKVTEAHASGDRILSHEGGEYKLTSDGQLFSWEPVAAVGNDGESIAKAKGAAAVAESLFGDPKLVEERADGDIIVDSNGVHYYVTSEGDVFEQLELLLKGEEVTKESDEVYFPKDAPAVPGQRDGKDTTELDHPAAVKANVMAVAWGMLDKGIPAAVVIDALNSTHKVLAWPTDSGGLTVMLADQAVLAIDEHGCVIDKDISGGGDSMVGADVYTDTPGGHRTRGKLEVDEPERTVIDNMDKLAQITGGTTTFGDFFYKGQFDSPEAALAEVGLEEVERRPDGDVVARREDGTEFYVTSDGRVYQYYQPGAEQNEENRARVSSEEMIDPGSGLPERHTMGVGAGLNKLARLAEELGIPVIGRAQGKLKKAVVGDPGLYDLRIVSKQVTGSPRNKRFIVAGYASPVMVDLEGHQIERDALARDLPRFMAGEGTYANVNVMHSNVTVGRILPEFTGDDGTAYKTAVDDRGLFVVAEVRTDEAAPAICHQVIKDIEDGKLKSFSISGNANNPVFTCVGDRCFYSIKDLQLYEITLSVIPGTKIAIKGGDILIEDIKPGALVKTHRHRHRSVTQTNKVAYEGELVRLTMDNGRVLELTPKHRVRVKRAGGIRCWVYPVDLQEGDELVTEWATGGGIKTDVGRAAQVAGVTSEEFKKKRSELQKAKWREPEYRETMLAKLAETRERTWANPAFRERWFRAINWSARHRRGGGPNRAERDLLELVGRFGFRFVGDGRKCVGGKFPDFWNGNGKVIELYGDYWHSGQDPQERVDLFKAEGYDCLVVWEGDWRADPAGVAERVAEFSWR